MTTGTAGTRVEGIVTGERRLLRGGTSWGAIWAGFFVTLGVETLFTILMIGIFASFVHPGGGTPSGLSFGIGIAIWFFLQTIGSYYCGGWVAGMLARKPESGWNAMHSFAVWALSTVVITYALVSGAGSAFAGTLSLLRTGLGMAAASAPMASAGTASVGQTVAAIGRGAQSAGSIGVAIATWIPIFLFITFGVSFLTAMLGGRSAPAVEQ